MPSLPDHVVLTSFLNFLSKRSQNLFYLTGFMLCMVTQVHAQSFVDATPSTFPSLVGVGGMYHSFVAWYDYDQDGDLDAIGTGEFDVNDIVTGVYNNDGSGLMTLDNPIVDSIIPVRYNDVSFTDHNLDGLPDFALAGEDGNGQPLTMIYTQAPSGLFFRDFAAVSGMPDVRHAALDWGDYDNDGDDDLLLSGETASGAPVTKLFTNDGPGGFIENVAASSSFVQVWGGDLEWGDANNDGFPDIVISGENAAGQPVLAMYKNLGNGSFSALATPLVGLAGGSAAWGDLDNDGDLDVIATGTNAAGIPTTVVYNNGIGGFTLLSTPLVGVANGGASLGDYNQDTRLDILLFGNDGTATTTRLYDNTGANFVENIANSAILTNVDYGSAVWGDYDNDTKLDIMLTGNVTTIPSRAFIIYRNISLTASILVGAPQNLQASQSGQEVVFSWDSPLGVGTGSNGLSYNLYISDTPGAATTKNVLAQIPSGYRREVGAGNMGHNTSWAIRDLQPGTYYWSVQAISAAWEGINFAAEQSFTLQNADFEDVSALVSLNSDVKGLRNGDLEWADYDNDDDLDLVVLGDTANGAFTRLYRNDGATGFTPISTSFAQLSDGCAAWADFNQDGWVDLLLAGDGTIGTAKLYQNNGSGGFIDLPNSISILTQAEADWGDYDNDGDVDLLIAGKAATSLPATHLYRNDGSGQLVNTGAPFVGVQSGSVDWGDFDRDGDLDVLITGTALTGAVSRVYENEGNDQWTLLSAGIPNVSEGDAEWADMNNDGYLDILITGVDPLNLTGSISELYLFSTSTNTFVNSGATMSPVSAGEIIAGDYNDDGFRDVLLTGTFSNVLPVERITHLYQNDGTGLLTKDVLNSDVLKDLNNSSAAWADVDRDGKLDVILAGERDNLGNSLELRLYRNVHPDPNTVPGPPQNLLQDQSGTQVKLGWDPPVGTPVNQVNGLMYNLVIGTVADPLETRSPESSLTDGTLRVVKSGSENGESWILNDLVTGTYRWSVQAIDQDFEGSGFAPSSTFSYVAPDLNNTTDSTLFPGQTPFGLKDATLEWGDYDNDGDLDLLAMGDSATSNPVTILFRNNLVSGFEIVSNTFSAIRSGAAAWGDYNNDGWLDLVIGGIGVGGKTTELYQNNGNGTFTIVNAGFPGLSEGSLAWADYDRDGRLDLLMTGTAGLTKVSRLYRNTGTGFINANASLEPIESGIGIWGDFDRNGYPDILISGSAASGPVTELYQNDANGGFSTVATGISGYADARAAFADMDNDGYLDLAISGNPSPVLLFPETKVYRFNPVTNSFQDIAANMTPVSGGDLAWGDYNDDGNIDLLATGWIGPVVGTNSQSTQLYQNTGLGGFVLDTLNSQQLTNVNTGSAAAWADYDQDGKLDLAIAGSSQQGSEILLFQNTETSPNSQPTAPQNLVSAQVSNGMKLTWDPPTGQANAVTYNLYVGSSPGARDIIGAEANLTNGFRQINALGNSYSLAGAALRDLSSGIYYWSVQAIDRDWEGSPFAAEQSFVYVAPTLVDVTDSTFLPVAAAGLSNAVLSWGDYDADGDLDLVATGASLANGYALQFYKNNGSTFTLDIAAAVGISGVINGSLAWGDVNADGWIDLLICGETTGGIRSTRLLQNNNGAFSLNTTVSATLTNVSDGDIAWVDVDNDSDLDIWLTGTAATGPLNRLFENNGSGVFSLLAASSALVQVDASAGDWGDFDRDGDLDLVIMGESAAGREAKVYRNDGAGTFVDIGALLVPLLDGSVEWGDLDNDGYADLLFTGESANGANGFQVKVYRYTPLSQSFIEGTVPLSGVVAGLATWGDYNDDGFLDILIAGKDTPSNNARLAEVYLNTGALGFVKDSAASINLIPVGSGAAAVWGDYNGDGKLDIALAGEQANNTPILRLYQNLDPTPNTTPAAPQNLQALVSGFEVNLTWSPPAGIDPTQVNGLTYNVYLGTTSGAIDLISPLAKVPAGYRRIVKSGMQSQSLTLPLNDLPGGTYYWSVQAVDQDFEGSPFAAESSFQLEVPTFLDVSTTTFPGVLGGVNEATLDWGDYDGDNDLDLLITGATAQSGFNAVLFRNDLGIFSQDAIASAVLAGVSEGDADWGDYDRDGDLDLVITGGLTSGGNTTVYQNNGNNTFTAIAAGLPALRQSRVDWGDYDNDGDLDILLAGNGVGGIAQAAVYEQDNGVFTSISIPIAGVYDGAVKWIDVDTDGDLDIFIMGNTGAGAISRLYENQGQGQFIALPTGWVGLTESSAAWSDYDNDGDSDVLITGLNGSLPETYLYRNDGGVFVAVVTPFVEVFGGSLAWGDYNDDGFPDVLMTGSRIAGAADQTTRLYQNVNGTSFVIDTVNSAYVAQVDGGSQGIWGDFDANGKLDMAITGVDLAAPATNTLRLYENIGTDPNLSAPAPGTVQFVQDGFDLLLTWSPPVGYLPALTPGLTYNLYIGTSPGQFDQVAPASNIATGWRRIVETGNKGQNTSWRFSSPTPNTYYAAVQAIEADLEGSPFSGETSFVFEQPDFVDRTDSLFGPSVQALDSAAVAWADFDNDGDLDLLAAGLNTLATPVTVLYRNDGVNGWAAVTTPFPAVSSGSLTWVDYDRDGALDVLISGRDALGVPLLALFKNDGSGAFLQQSFPAPGLVRSAADWADIDHDGDMDVVLSGQQAGGSPFTGLFEQVAGGLFQQATSPFTAVENGSLEWSDANQDGWSDLLLTGNAATGPVSVIYQNNGDGTFVDLLAGLPGVGDGEGKWQDYDNDGFVDLALVGKSIGSPSTSQAYLFHHSPGSGQFVNAGVALLPVNAGAVQWGDYDNDGWSDLFISGTEGLTGNPTSQLFHNQSGSTFIRDTLNSDYLTDFGGSLASAWGDYDRDGKLDLFCSGPTSSGLAWRLFQNIEASPATSPGPPEGLLGQVAGNEVTLIWNPPSSHPTNLVSGLTYNLYVATVPAGSNQVSSMSETLDGYRRIVHRGNVGHASNFVLKDLAQGTYFWSVQAVDPDFEGSPFATPEQSFSFVPPDLEPVTSTLFPGTGPIGLSEADLKWGDYDNDEDLDLLMAGMSTNGPLTALYEQTTNGFQIAAANLPNVSESDMDWGDYDNDGWLDVLITGEGVSGPLSAVYRNTGAGTFVNANIPLIPLRDGTATWIDMDQDGLLDIFLMGVAVSNPIVRLYRNEGDGTFQSIPHALLAVGNGSAAWADYDADGRSDVVLSGETPGGPVTSLYRNEGGFQFTPIPAPLEDVANATLAWADMDVDGDPDLLLAGEDGTGFISKVYRNDGNGSFVDLAVSLAGVSDGEAAWGDFNDDGYPDIALTGENSAAANGRTTRLYQNTAGSGFVELSANSAILTDLDGGSALAWGDYDGDQKLDLAIIGQSRTLPIDRTFALYRNTESSPNILSEEPLSPTATIEGFEVMLEWEAPLAYPVGIRSGLSYNLQVGTSPGGSEIITPHASSIGYRRIAKMGNSGQETSFSLIDLEAGTYYWQVQSVEADFEGSPFTTIDSFTYFPPSFVNSTDTTFAGGLPPGLEDAHLSWVDIDMDKDLDLFVMGKGAAALPQVRMYRNEQGNLTDDPLAVSQVIPVLGASVDWGDMNGDGFPDVAIVGEATTGPATRLYRNDGMGALIPFPAGLPDLQEGTSAWGDFDNDGDADLLLSGTNGAQNLTRLYQLKTGTFTAISTGFEAMSRSAAAWGDYDNDGDADLVIAGAGDTQNQTILYRNNGDSTFSQQNVPFEAVIDPTLEWGDYDNDGRMDLLLSGQAASGPVTKVYHNDGAGVFTELPITLPGITNGQVAWGDYNDDGFLDIALTGESTTGRLAQLFQYDGGNFVLDNGNSVLFRDLNEGSHLAWGDVDADGKLDLAFAGRLSDNPETSALLVFRNIDSTQNEVPDPPENLNEEPFGPDVILFWDAPANHDPNRVNGLTYQVFMGTRPDSVNVISPLAQLGDGFRNLVQTGNMGHRKSWRIKGLPEGEYYWSVQAIDQDFEGSGFTAPIQSFTFVPTVFKDETDSLFLDQSPNPLNESALSWGDYDNDGDLDILASGEVDSLFYSASVYRNLGDRFEEDALASVNLVGVRKSDAQWGDYNLDGWLDILLCGEDVSGNRITHLYKNTGGDFTWDSASQNLVGVIAASASWGDYDNDGDLDILLIGSADSGRIAHVYRNDRHLGFALDSLASSALAGVEDGDVDWGDYDADGYLDVLLSGNADSGPLTQVYRNQGNSTFLAVSAPIIDVKESAVAWGDYDNDGFLDVLLNGESSTSLFDPVSRVYRYVDSLNSFANIGAPLLPVKDGSVDWGDYNDDGYLDILMTGRFGEEDTARTSRVYRNTGAGNFTLELNTSASLENIELGTSAWGDYDNDQKLDIILTGKTADEPVARTFAVYRNIDNIPNISPSLVAGLQDSVIGDEVILTWEAPAGMPDEQLSYNLMVGVESDVIEVLSPMSHTGDGYRQIVREGNVGKRKNWRLKDLLPGRYYWQVQSVDADWEGSPFSTEIGQFDVYSTVPVIIDSAYNEVYSEENTENTSWVEILDTTVVKQVLLHYKGLAEADWLQEELQSTDAFFPFEMLPDHLDEQGVEYFFEAVGKFGVNARTDTTYAMRFYSEPGLTISNFTIGTTVKDYNIFTVPLTLRDSSIITIIEDELGTYDIFEWRFWHYQNGQNQEYQSGLNHMSPGQGYWLITKNPLPEANTGSGTTVYAHDGNGYTLQLNPGWNQIGNPYLFNLSWDEVMAHNSAEADSLLGDLIRFQNGFIAGDRLDQFEGGFIFADEAVELEIPIRKNPFIQRFGEPRHQARTFGTLEAEKWEVDITLTSGEYRFPLGGFGMNPAADIEKDPYDAIAVPRLNEFLEMSFEHPEFFAPKFSRDIVPRAKQYVWEFAVSGNLDEEIVLTWDNSHFGQGSPQLILFDVSRQRSIDMRKAERYASWSEVKARHFRVYYGDAAFVESQLTPDFIHLGQAYPNPFAESVLIPIALPMSRELYHVSLTISDLAGRRIKQLANGEFDPGFYEYLWDGESDEGEKVASGMYIYRLTVRFDGKIRQLSGKLKRE